MGSLPIDLFPEDITKLWMSGISCVAALDRTPHTASKVIRASLKAGYDGVTAENIRDGGGPTANST